MEYQINLEDAVIKGSEENIDKVDRVFSTYQVRLNRTNFEADAFLTCQNNTFFECGDHLYKNGIALRKMKEWALNGLMNASESRKAVSEIQRIDDVLKSGSDDEKYVLMHRFHNEYLDKGIVALQER